MRSVTLWVLPLIMASLVSTRPVFGQLVSVRCCTEQSHLDAMPKCVSGDGNTTRPSTCRAGATCVLGFGENAQLAQRLCDPRNPEVPHPTRAHCSTWSLEALPVVVECVANPTLGVDLFSVFDDDGDGDLDESDVAEFEEFRGVVPKLVQSEAILTLVECCVPSAIFRLSGPDITATPFAATCLAGFSKPVELGDYLYELCGSPPTDVPSPSESFCVSWQIDTMPPGFYCAAADFVQQAIFVVADTDDDSDVDLFDFAAFQRDQVVEY